MPTYSIGGVTGPAGSPTEVGAPDLGALPAVSASTPASLIPDEDSGGWEHAWWTFTPTETGLRWVDPSLSYDSSGAPLPSYVDVYTYDGSSYDFYAGDGIDTYEAGVTYYVSVGREFGDGDGSSFMVLRVSDLPGPPGDWVQPDDQAWWKGGNLQGENLPVATVGTLNWPDLDSGPSFHGVHINLQPFAGGFPGTDPDAVDCSWNKARQGDYATTFWTSDGTGTGDPGAPVCIPQDPGNGPSGNSRRVGVNYEATGAEAFPIPAAEGFDVWSATVRFWLTPAVAALGRNGGLAAPAPPSGSTIEYESDACELLGVDAAPDENAHQDTDITVQWVGAAVPQAENPGDVWGPKQELTQFIGAGGGPEGFTGDYTLDDFPPDASVSDWTEIPSGVITAALGYEAAYDPLLVFAGGLRWVGVFPEQSTSSPPGLATPVLSPPETYTDIRDEQIVAVRLRVRPARYRFQAGPVLPDVDTGAVTRNWPRGDDLGASVAPRNYPVPKSSTRTYGQEP